MMDEVEADARELGAALGCLLALPLALLLWALLIVLFLWAV